MGDQDEVDDQGRSVKKCKLCGVSCFTKTPLVRGSPLQEGWGDQIPWFRGTCDSPVGRFDKPCVLAYNLSMLHDKGPLKVYVKNIAKDPTKHAEEFLPARRKWIENHNANPTGRVGGTSISDVKVTVGSTHTDELEAPEEEFVTEESWANAAFKRTGVRPRRQDHPELKWKQRKFRGTVFWGYDELVGDPGRFKVRRKDSTHVTRQGNLHDGQELRAGEAEAKAIAARDSLLTKTAELSKMDFDSVLALMQGEPEQAGEGKGKVEENADDDDAKGDELVEAANPFKATRESN